MKWWCLSISVGILQFITCINKEICNRHWHFCASVSQYCFRTFLPISRNEIRADKMNRCITNPIDLCKYEILYLNLNTACTCFAIYVFFVWFFACLLVWGWFIAAAKSKKQKQNRNAIKFFSFVSITRHSLNE